MAVTLPLSDSFFIFAQERTSIKVIMTLVLAVLGEVDYPDKPVTKLQSRYRLKALLGSIQSTAIYLFFCPSLLSHQPFDYPCLRLVKVHVKILTSLNLMRSELQEMTHLAAE